MSFDQEGEKKKREKSLGSSEEAKAEHLPLLLTEEALSRRLRSEAIKMSKILTHNEHEKY